MEIGRLVLELGRSGRAEAAPRSPGADSQLYAWYVVFIVFLVNILNFMDRMALAVLAPSIAKDLQLTDSQLGLLTGLAFAIFYSFAAIPIARLADRSSRRNIIAISLAVWSVMTALSGLAQNYWQLFLARMGLGAGEAGGGPPAQSLLCDYVPLHRRPLAIAVSSVGFGVGIAVGMALAGWLGHAVGWRLAFVLLGAPGLVVALIMLLTVREPRRGRFDAAAVGMQPPLPRTLNILWRNRVYSWLVIYAAFASVMLFGLNQWWPTFLVRVHGLPIQEVGVKLGAGMGLGASAGLLVGGVLGSRLARHGYRGPLIVAMISLLAIIPLGIGANLVSNTDLAIWLMTLSIFCHGCSTAPTAAAVYSSVNSEIRTTAGAIAVFSQSVVGASTGPLVVGLISEHLQPSYGDGGLRYGLMFPVLAVIPAALALAAAILAVQRSGNLSVGRAALSSAV